jgi:hypothetical protein
METFIVTAAIIYLSALLIPLWAVWADLRDWQQEADRCED